MLSTRISRRPRESRRRFIHFFNRQIEQIGYGGLPIMYRKGRKALSLLLKMPITFVAFLVVSALRPMVTIRFGRLHSSRMGHFAGNTEIYLCERGLSNRTAQTFDIFCQASPVCNQQLRRMWDRVLHVSPLARLVDSSMRYLPSGEKHVISWPYNDRDVHGLLERTRVHLSFTSEEERRGNKALQSLNISKGVPFICFLARSSAYLQARFSNRDLRYHNYRDSSIKNFVPAAEELVRRGYFALRMGATVEEPLQTTNPMIIDYATESRTEFLDIFLGARCHFYLGDPCGFHAIPMVFRRPLAIVNMIPLEYAPTWSSNYLFIPKKLWLREECRFLGFREILDSGIGRFLRTKQYEQLGIEVVENAPEEITALAVEMDERLKGTWETTREDEELQQYFWSLFKPSELNGVFLSRIGAEFLRQNRELLE